MEEEEKSKSLAKLKNKHEAMITDLEGKRWDAGSVGLGVAGASTTRGPAWALLPGAGVASRSPGACGIQPLPSRHGTLQLLPVKPGILCKI